MLLLILFIVFKEKNKRVVLLMKISFKEYEKKRENIIFIL